MTATDPEQTLEGEQGNAKRCSSLERRVWPGTAGRELRSHGLAQP